jgi:hypothetical protein
VLGLIVVIRTFLRYSLETEIEGVAPWRRALIGGAGTIRRASASALDSDRPPDTGLADTKRTGRHADLPARHHDPALLAESIRA